MFAAERVSHSARDVGVGCPGEAEGSLDGACWEYQRRASSCLSQKRELSAG